MVAEKRAASDFPAVDEAPGEVEPTRSAPPGYGAGTTYWNKRYRADPKPFEWLEGFDQLKGLIADCAGERGTEADVLHVGCGNSLLPEDMYDAGYRSIVNTDISAVALQQMTERNRELRPELQWLEVDATQMKLDDGMFDLVVDKSVLDTMCCGDNAPAVIGRYLKEVLRVLVPSGTFLCVSYGAPADRLSYFEPLKGEHSVQYVVVQKHHAYIVRKGLAKK